MNISNISWSTTVVVHSIVFSSWHPLFFHLFYPRKLNLKGYIDDHWLLNVTSITASFIQQLLRRLISCVQHYFCHVRRSDERIPTAPLRNGPNALQSQVNSIVLRLWGGGTSNWDEVVGSYSVEVNVPLSDTGMRAQTHGKRIITSYTNMRDRLRTSAMVNKVTGSKRRTRTLCR